MKSPIIIGIIAAISSVPALACGPNSSSSSTSTTTTQGVVITRHKQNLQKRVIILGRERTNEHRNEDADEAVSQLLGMKTYHISEAEAARRRKRDIEFYALKKQLGQLNNDELQHLNSLVKQEIQRRGR